MILRAIEEGRFLLVGADAETRRLARVILPLPKARPPGGRAISAISPPA